MNKFVAALLWLLGGLIAAGSLAYGSAARPGAMPHEPIPVPIWTIETIASGGYVHALALDSLDRPHLLTQSTIDGRLRYATRDAEDLPPGEWRYDDITDFDFNWFFLTFDLAIGPDDTPCLVYATRSSGDFQPLDSTLQYGCRGPDGWVLSGVDDGGAYPQLALGADGRPHIALMQGSSLVYMTFEDELWRREILATDSSRLSLAQLMVDGAGQGRVLYTSSQGRFLATRTAYGVWTTTAYPTTAAQDLELDATDRLWLARSEATDVGGHPPIYYGKLFLGWPQLDGGHTMEQIDEGYDAFYFVDLTLVGDAPHLAYRGVDGAVNYVWWTPEGRQSHPPGGDWQRQPAAPVVQRGGRAKAGNAQHHSAG